MSDELIQKMLEKAKIAMNNAYSPYSHFKVGACVLADDGQLYAGCNVENVCYHATHAEVAAVVAMISAGAKRVKSIVIVADCDKIIVPCGSCRQHLREFAPGSLKIYMFNKAGESRMMVLEDLLIHSFGPEYLEESCK